MRSTLVISGLTALAVAAPHPAPQQIDFDSVIPAIVSTQVPTGTASATATYDATSALSSAAVQATQDPVASTKRSLARRDSCSAAGSDDTTDAFLANTAFAAKATGAATPNGYSSSFTNEVGATEGSGYLTYYLLKDNFDPSSDTYDVSACAQKCDDNKDCLGFNVFVERTPTCSPTADLPNPASKAILKCSIWGLPVDQSTATNVGQWSGSGSQWFHTVITASNGYNKSPFQAKTIAGFTAPITLKGAVQAPGYIGMRFFNVFDVSLCATVCTETTAFDKQHIRHTINGDADHFAYDACNFFNVYVLSDGTKPTGMYCSMYQDSHTYDESTTNVGQWRDNVFWGVSYSFGYTLDPEDKGKALYAGN